MKNNKKLVIKIENIIKIHMYDKGVVHFQLWNDQKLIEKITTKYSIDKKFVSDIYIDLAFDFTFGNSKETHLELYIELFKKHRLSVVGITQIGEEPNYRKIAKSVLKLSFMSGKSFENILKIFSEMKLDYCQYHSTHKNKIKMDLLSKLTKDED